MINLIGGAPRVGKSIVAKKIAETQKVATDAFRSLFIGLIDVDRAVEGIMKNTSPNNWLSESNPDVVRQVADFVVASSLYIRNEAERYSLSYQERIADFDGDMERLSKQLLGI